MSQLNDTTYTMFPARIIRASARSAFERLLVPVVACDGLLELDPGPVVGFEGPPPRGDPRVSGKQVLGGSVVHAELAGDGGPGRWVLIECVGEQGRELTRHRVPGHRQARAEDGDGAVAADLVDGDVERVRGHHLILTAMRSQREERL